MEEGGAMSEEMKEERVVSKEMKEGGVVSEEMEEGRVALVNFKMTYFLSHCGRYSLYKIKLN